MAAGDKNYKVNVAISLVPIEETVLADGTTKMQNLHSLIDKGEGAQMTLLGNTDPLSVTLISSYTIPARGNRNISQITGRVGNLVFLFVRVISGEAIQVSEAMGANPKAYLNVGQCVLLPYNGNASAQNLFLGQPTYNDTVIDVLAVYA